MADLQNFQKEIGVTFNDEQLLQTAFTHRSYVNEHPQAAPKHNERLEFLGDAVLELVVTKFLFTKYTDKPEGELTAYRAALVNTSTLSTVATGLHMNNYLLLSKGESQDTGRARQYILANTFEAFVGALYLDRGYGVARDFIATHLLVLTDDVVNKRLWQDAKSYLQEKVQEIVSITPHYTVLAEEGPDHDKQFRVGVFFGEDQIAEGAGHSKQEAEQEAARVALEKKGWL